MSELKIEADDDYCTVGVWPPREPVDSGWVTFKKLTDSAIDLHLQRMLNLWIHNLSDSAKRRVIAELWLAAGQNDPPLRLPSDLEIAEYVLHIQRVWGNPKTTEGKGFEIVAATLPAPTPEPLP